MDLLNKGDYNLHNLGKVNIILGKNGCGKSTALKAINEAMDIDQGLNRYLSPERGGHLLPDPNLEHGLNVNGRDWANQQQRQNQYSQFKQASVVLYRQLETLTLREIENNLELRANHDYTFDTIVSSINDLLSNIEIRRNDNAFDIYTKVTGEKLANNSISSGESELISLAIESLHFEKKSITDEINVLFIDEPDVHLHPDLQVKFANFLMKLLERGKFVIILSTHSTALLGGFFGYPYARFTFMATGQREFEFKPIDEVYSRILPIFGAHPLSNLFNESPILLVEGEDDVRIWQQAVRTSEGQLKVYPCSVDTITNLSSYEEEVVSILTAIYDNAKGYSLRDRDDEPEDIDDKTPVVRFRLSCRNAENLMLSDEVLSGLNTTWGEMQERIEVWIKNNNQHPKYKYMVGFRDSGYERKTFQLKQIRNDLIGLSNSNKSWEIAVGQSLGRLKKGEIEIDMNDNKISNYLGNKVIDELFR